MKFLWKAIGDALRLDATMAELTEDQDDDMRIVVWEPDLEIKYPSLVFWDSPHEPWIGQHSEFKKTRVNFGGFAETKITCDNILTRMEELLDQKDSDPQEKYWNVSDDDITNNWTRMIGRATIEYDDARHVYHGTVVCEMKWFIT